MPVLVRLLFVLIATATVAQTTGDLSARYGDPDAERFVVRPGITLMASYTEHGTVCELMIEPEHSIQQPDGTEQGMATDTATEIIDELIPRSERGILLDHIIENMGAGELQVAEYQNVTISRYFVRYLPANRDEKSATVVRKDMVCKPRNAPPTYAPAMQLTAIDLHSRYGDPGVGRFTVRPGISLMVTYGAHREACQMVVEPVRSIIPSDEPDKEMRPESIKEVLDELLPEQSRGRVVTSYTLFTGGHAMRHAEYESVVISHALVHMAADKPEMETRMTIDSKESACQQLDK